MPIQNSAPANLDDVPGWFSRTDQLIMDWVLSYQESQGVQGDLCELGTYVGKSAILVGAHRQPGETFTVCDLFDSPAPDAANAAETRRSYPKLTRDTFERNYLAFHDQLPVIVEGPTATIGSHVRAGSCRFVHVDASHQYRHVAGDVAAARTMLRPDGVVVLDDYRSAHTPGVAAAVWFAVHSNGLLPLCVSPHKMYATWGDPAPLRKALLEWLREDGSGWSEHEIAGFSLVQIADWPATKPSPLSAPPPAVPALAAVPASVAAPASIRRRGATRGLIVDLLPPVVTRCLRRARKRLERDRARRRESRRGAQ